MLQPDRAHEKNRPTAYNEFSRRQKTAVIVLACLTLVIVVVWILQMSYQIRKPFQSPDQASQSSVEELNLTLADSDNDGLNDYDEINVYKTSPYLEDSDSDEISDYDEVAQGTDPTCASGTNCYADEPLLNQNNESSLEIGSSSVETEIIEGQGTEEVIDSSEVTPTMLRQILLESGYDVETLNQISDADLMASYQEALKVQDESILE